LAAFSRVPMDLYADGRRIGSTDDGQLLLPPGVHNIDFVSDRFNFRSTVTLTIRSGQVTPHTLMLPTGMLRVTTSAGAEVWIEGERVGVARMNAIPVSIGTHEVVVKDPAGGERHQAVEVRFGETSELTMLPSVNANSATGPPPIPHLAPLSQYKPK